MFVWTVSSDDQNWIELLKLLQDKYDGKFICKNILDKLNHCHLSHTFDKYIKACLKYVCKHPSNEESRVFLSEFISGMKYAQNPKVGKLRKFNSVYEHNKSILKKFMKEQLQKCSIFQNGDVWFRFRVAVMDAYTLGRILKDKFHHAVFYGGANHAQNILDFITHNMTHKIVHIKHIDDFCKNSQLMFVKHVFINGKCISFIAEAHNKTSMSFHTKMLQFLNEWCKNTNKTLYLYIEKHIFSKHDVVPRSLACNMTNNMAIHKIRCDPFCSTKHPCKNVVVKSVDNRHYDLGFFRAEIFDLCNYCKKIKKYGQQFQEKVLATNFHLD